MTNDPNETQPRRRRQTRTTTKADDDRPTEEGAERYLRRYRPGEDDVDVIDDGGDDELDLLVDCDFAATFASLEPRGWRLQDRATDDVLVHASRLADLATTYVDLIGPAVTKLTDDVFASRQDLCDDELTDALFCRRQRFRSGEHPSEKELATASASVLGIRSALSSVAPSSRASRLRAAIHAAILETCGADLVRSPCIGVKLAALSDGYLEIVDQALGDGNRNVVHRATIASAGDSQVLRHPAVQATYGTGCGRSALAVGLAILGRSPRLARSYVRRADLWHRFGDVIALPDDANEEDVRSAGAAYLRSYWAIGHVGDAGSAERPLADRQELERPTASATITW